MATLTKQAVPDWVRSVDALNTYLTQNLLGGPKHLKMAWAVNLHKFATIFVVALLMLGFNNDSPAAWIYLALHGTYGFCWLLKHLAFRDPKWETRITYGGAVVVFVMLATYWVAPYLLISGALGAGRSAPPDWLIALSIIVFALGLAIMTGADSQKYFTLKLQRGLITTGMFRYVRHPNYLGEMMIYGSFALLVQHWLPWLILIYWWTCIFYVNMVMIEASLSRYPEWEAYKARTGMLLPWKFFAGEPSSPQPLPR